MNPVGVGPSEQRVAEGIQEVPCCVNPVAMLRVIGLAERYLKDHPEWVGDFQVDVDACTRACDIYSMVWNEVNKDRKFKK